ncbi:MAG: hypothetical protein ACI4WH_07855 [Oscillospiraceae bacterium]
MERRMFKKRVALVTTLLLVVSSALGTMSVSSVNSVNVSADTQEYIGVTLDSNNVINLDNYQGLNIVGLSFEFSEKSSGNGSLQCNTSSGWYSVDYEYNDTNSVYVDLPEGIDGTITLCVWWNSANATVQNVKLVTNSGEAVTTNTTVTTTATTTQKSDSTVSTSSAVHNFTTDGINSDTFSIVGNLSTSKGSMTYNGLTLTQCLKMESSTSIQFTASADTTLNLVIKDGSTIKVDGNAYDISTSGVTSISVSKGSHTITKGSGSSNLFYIELGSAESSTPVVTTTVTTTTTPVTTTTTTTTTTSSDVSVSSNAIYCSPSGSGDGSSKSNPTSVTSAIKNVKAGQTIYMLGGTYKFSKTLNIEESNSGTANAYKTIMAYPGETVVWDFSALSVSDSNRGVLLQGDYWHFKDFEITKAGDNGMLLSGSNNKIELMVFNNNQDTGLQISRYKSSYTDISQWPSNNLILNCTSKNNCDDATMENADGFAAKLTCGEGNVFDGCMSYNNSDDGWDLYAKTETGPIGVVTLKNCIAFRNGYTEDGRGYGDCDGNGFKLGGGGVGTAHIVENCLAFENLNCGFTDNNNPKLGSLKNCTAFNNGVGGNGKANYMVYRCTTPGCNFDGLISYYNDDLSNALAPGASKKIGSDKFNGTISNSVIYNSSKYYKVSSSTSIANGQTVGSTTSVSDSDFQSVTVAKMGTDFHKVWRNADGSINTNGFMEVNTSSALKGLGYSNK